VGGEGGGGGESNATLKPAKPSLIEVVLFQAVKAPLLSIIKNSCGVHTIIYLFIILYIYIYKYYMYNF
jgi:hypothetical protein